MESIGENEIHANEITYTLPDGVPEKYFKGGAFLFAAYGCALTERRTPGGMCVCTAVNLNNGKSVILSRRKNKLDRNGFEDMAAKISALPIRGGGRLNIDRKPGEIAKISELEQTLNQIFTEILPKYGYAVREKQIELAEHILAVTGKRGVTLAESEVGTGKTHAYLIAAVLAKRGRLNDFWLRGHYPRQSWAESAYMPVVISTSSIALQNAIMTDYIPELSQILMRHGVISTPLTAVVRKGREHYICEQRFQRYYESADAQTKALLAPFSGANATFDLTGADSLPPGIKRGVCVTGRCPHGCPNGRKCRYASHMKQLNDPAIDFQITNHNYFLADVLRRANMRRPLLPDYQLVIIDEAHKFLSAARSMYGLELTADEFPELAREVHTIAPDKPVNGVNIHRLAKKLEEQGGKLFQKLTDNIPAPDEDDDSERFPAVMDGDVCRFLKKLSGISADISEAIAGSRVHKMYGERQSKAVRRLNMIGERVNAFRRHDNLICWFEKRTESETGALCAIQKDLNERLYRDLWRGGIPIVLTSGTLSAARDFTRAKETLGLDRMPRHKLFETSKPSPFNYRGNTLLYISEKTPFPDNKDKDYVAAIADEIEKLIITAHGHAAALFTSYNVMGRVYSLLKDRLPFPLFRLERGGIRAIERFKKSGNAVLFASGALWEGIDIPGDALSLLIIVKLPFAVPDPIGDYERSLCGGMDIYKARAVVPDMLVKLKQGFGRLIRTETDTGVAAILDSRANSRGAYRNRVSAALPGCRVTSDLSDVGRFFRAKKPPEYFD